MIVKIQFFTIFYLLSTACTIAADAINFDASLAEKIKEIKLFYNSGKYSDVVKEAERILSIHPKNEIATDLFMIGKFKQKQFKDIINYYNETQAEYITSHFQLKVRAIAQARDGNYYSSMLAIRSLKALVPFNNEWKKFYHYIVYKINADSAYKELQRISKNTSSVSADIITADLYQLAGQSKMAIAALETALTKDYLNQDALEGLGNLYFENNNWEKSIAAYTSLLKINPHHSSVKIKIAKAYIVGGRLWDAMNILDNDARVDVVSLRNKISKQSQDLLTGQSTRSIAQVELAAGRSETVSKGISDENFIPQDIDVYADSITKSEATVTPATFVDNLVTKDTSVFEFSLSPKTKKYDLSGTGFNANVGYSNGVSANSRFTFYPAGRQWLALFDIQHSQTSLKNLSGLSPSLIILRETNASIGLNYLRNDFSLGPALMFETMSGTQTTPNNIRGNVDCFNLGLRSTYSLRVGDHWKFNFEASYFSKIISASKTSSVGNVGSRSIILASNKIIYSPGNTLGYFLGFSFSDITTKYEGTQTRGTSAAVETERDLSIPLGINYVF